MLELKPNPYNKFACPECESNDIKVCDIVFPGIHVLADCNCLHCNLEFYIDFPNRNALYYPAAIGKSNDKLYDKKNVKWFSRPLIESYREKSNADLPIEKKVFKEKKQVILLNCLDFCYGHVFLKLMNAQAYIDNYQQYGLIIIIPKIFEWLLPEGTAEAWIVKVKLGEARNWFIKFDEFVKTEIQRFDRVFLSVAFPQPDFTDVDIAKFTGVEKFDIAKFAKNELNITFISREDRFWHGLRVESLLFLALWKLKLLKYAKRYFIIRQNRFIKQTFQRIRKVLPEAKLNIAGFGKRGKFPQCVNDYRTNSINAQIEVEWCKLYAKSQLVIGVHGSNMHLPTAHSGGFIEIVPETRYGNYLQDISTAIRGIDLLYLGRFVHEFITPRLLAYIAVNMIKGYPVFRLTFRRENMQHQIYDDLRDLSSKHTIAKLSYPLW